MHILETDIDPVELMHADIDSRIDVTRVINAIRRFPATQDGPATIRVWQEAPDVFMRHVELGIENSCNHIDLPL